MFLIVFKPKNAQICVILIFQVKEIKEWNIPEDIRSFFSTALKLQSQVRTGSVCFSTRFLSLQWKCFNLIREREREKDVRTLKSKRKLVHINNTLCVSWSFNLVWFYLFILYVFIKLHFFCSNLFLTISCDSLHSYTQALFLPFFLLLFPQKRTILASVHFFFFFI